MLGSNKIIRLNTATGISKAEVAYATLGTLFNRVSSTLYVPPYFYFGTNEPNAVLGRIHKDNFCSFECDENAYCWAQGCLCAPGYGPDPTKTNPKTGQPYLSFRSSPFLSSCLLPLSRTFPTTMCFDFIYPNAKHPFSTATKNSPFQRCFQLLSSLSRDSLLYSSFFTFLLRLLNEGCMMTISRFSDHIMIDSRMVQLIPFRAR